MWSFLESNWLLLQGFFKRFWPFAVFILLDAVDLYEGYLKGHINERYRTYIEMISDWGYYVLVIGALYSISRAFHDIRIEKEQAITRQIVAIPEVGPQRQEQTRLRKATGDQLASLYDEGSKLKKDILEDLDESHLDKWNRLIEEWSGEVFNYIRDNVSVGKALWTIAIATFPHNEVVYYGERQLSDEKSRLINAVNIRLDRLRRLSGDY